MYSLTHAPNSDSQGSLLLSDATRVELLCASGVLHMFGGVAGLWGALIESPRIGCFDDAGLGGEGVLVGQGLGAFLRDGQGGTSESFLKVATAKERGTQRRWLGNRRMEEEDVVEAGRRGKARRREAAAVDSIATSQHSWRLRFQLFPSLLSRFRFQLCFECFVFVAGDLHQIIDYDYTVRFLFSSEETLQPDVLIKTIHSCSISSKAIESDGF